MRVRLHVPELADAPADWSPRERSRLMEVCRRAQARAVAEAQRQGVRVELVSVRTRVAIGADETPAPEPQPFTRREVRERMSADRHRPDPAAARYEIPSYGAEGAPTQIALEDEPVVFADERVGRARSYEIGGDVLLLEPFGRFPVLMLAVDDHRYAESPRHVRAASLPRARQWGEALFGGAGYVILTPKSGPPVFITAGLDAPLAKDDLPDFPDAKPGFKGGRLIDPHGYDTVAVFTAEGTAFTRTALIGRWTPDIIATELARPWRPLRPADLALAAEIIAGRADQQDHPEATADAIALMDVELFRAVPWTERVKYLRLLARLGLDRARRSAVIAIVKACNTTSELDAMIGEIRTAGLYEQLFEEIDEEIYEFLQALADYAAPAPLDAAYIATLFLDQLGLKAPPRPGEGAEEPSALDDVSLAYQGVRGWIVGTLKSFAFMLSRPDKVIEGLGQLVELLWRIDKARMGDQAAQAELVTLARAVGHAIAKAIRGMELAEELGRPFAARGGHSRVGHDVVTRLRYAMAAEVLSWCVGLGEVRAAAVALPKAFGALAGLLSAILAGGRLATRAQRLERVLTLLATVSRLGEMSRVARLVELLPASELARLERVVAGTAVRRMEAAELAAVRNIRHVHQAVGGQVPIRDLDRLQRALEAADRLEAKAATAGLAREAVLPGFHALMDHLPWRGEQLVRIIESVPAERLAEYLHAMTFVRPEHFATLGHDFFRLAAGHPETLRLLTEAGSGIVVTLHANLGSFHLLDDLARRLAARRAEFGDPVAYRRFLDRLAQRDPQALARIAPESLFDPQDIAAWERTFDEAFPRVEGAAVEGASATARLHLQDMVTDAVGTLLREPGAPALGSPQFGTRLHAIVRGMVERQGLPQGYRLFVEDTLATITRMPAETAEMTVAEFLSRNPHIERTIKAPSGEMLSKVGRIKPDLVLIEPGGGVVLWDLTSRTSSQHLAKTSLYAALLDEFGTVGGKARIGETYWQIIRREIERGVLR